MCRNLALTREQKPWNAVHNDLTARLLSVFLTGHPSHQLVFLRIFQIDRQFLTAALRDFYSESEINVSRILDVAQDLKILDLVLELRPFFLALDLAASASRREYLNLDKWLASSIDQLGGVFVRATLEFVGHKVRHDLLRQELDPAPEPTTLTLSAATVALFMRALRLQYVPVLVPRRRLQATATSFSRGTTSSSSRRSGRSVSSSTPVS